MEIHNGDCLEVMKSLPDKSIDLFVCDLPYGCLSRSSIGALAEKKKFFSGNSVGCAWDIKLDLEAFWIQVKRLCKNDHTPVLMFCNTKFGYDLIKSNESWFRYDLVWNKMRGVSFLSANKMPMKSHELVYVFSKKGASYYRKDIEGDFPKSLVSKKVMTRKDILGNQIPKILTDNTGKRCVLSVIDNINKYSNSRVHKPHPTEKPVELYKWLIERYSKEGDSVLDPTFGSGNSGRGCVELKRNYIGIEKDKGFYDKFKLYSSSAWPTSCEFDTPACME
jgi:site-specific DNA-methyltransferase (adenine-specific)